MDVRLTTYDDLIQHALDYLGANPGGDASRDARRGVQVGFREFAAERRWYYYYTRGRITTNSPTQAGTVQYQQTSGGVPRQLTLTGATWPSWAAQGVIVLNNVVYEPATLVSSTVLTLREASNPGQDFPPGTVYTLYQDTYPLPVDCLAIDKAILLNNAFALWFEHPGTWLERQRIYYTPAVPRTYTITGSPDFMGSLVLRFFPPPDNQYNFDFIYHRRPRALKLQALSTGTVSVTNGSASVALAGSSWPSSLVGSVLRISPDTLNLPTSIYGGNPPLYERVILSVDSSTALTADAVFDQSLSGLKYTISDPVDIEDGAMLAGLFRGIEKQLAISRNMKTADRAAVIYREALIKACEADSRNFSMDREGPSNPYPYRLAQMPRGPDVS